MHPMITGIILGILAGTLARFLSLVVDYRQYPTYPHGYLTHLTFGVIASSLGAIAPPALVKGDLTAVTFLSLAAQQFREVRNVERENLMRLEETELVPRGTAYIEGIAKVFETRNYIAMLVSMFTSALYIILNPRLGGHMRIYIPLLSGIALYTLVIKGGIGKKVGDITDVREGRVRFEGSVLYVDEISIMNVGIEASRRRILKEGIGIVLEPKDDDARATLANMGQRQAILHDTATLFGAQIDDGEPDFTPLSKRNIKTGRIAVFFVPMERDIKPILEAVRRVPLLESAVRRPLATRAGRAASD